MKTIMEAGSMRVAFVTMFVFVSIGIHVGAEEILYCNMDSKAAISAVGGKFHGGKFVDAFLGKGILTKGAEKGVEFPTDGGKFLNREKGTIMMWVKVDTPIQNVKTESFLYISQAGSDQWRLVHSSPSFGRNTVAFAMHHGGAWRFVNAGELFWETGEIHHIAAVYGTGGMRLYVDFELVGENKDAKGVPPKLPVNQWVGGPTFWVQDEFRVFNTELSRDEIRKASILAVESSGKLATTWGKVKSADVRRSPAF